MQARSDSADYLCSFCFLSVIIIYFFIFLLPAVANVTTAVDIYSFGMCALEVRGDVSAFQLVSCLMMRLVASYFIVAFLSRMIKMSLILI